MLIRQIPDHVENNWEYYAPAIGKSLPPIVGRTRKGMINVLEAVLLEDLIVFNLTNEDQDELYAVVTAKVEYESISKTRNLLIYSFTSLETIPPGMWERTREELKKIAIANDCSNIIAYAKNKNVIEFFNKQGARTETTLIEMEV